MGANSTNTVPARTWRGAFSMLEFRAFAKSRSPEEREADAQEISIEIGIVEELLNTSDDGGTESLLRKLHWLRAKLATIQDPDRVLLRARKANDKAKAKSADAARQLFERLFASCQPPSTREEAAAYMLSILDTAAHGLIDRDAFLRKHRDIYRSIVKQAHAGAST